MPVDNILIEINDSLNVAVWNMWRYGAKLKPLSGVFAFHLVIQKFHSEFFLDALASLRPILAIFGHLWPSGHQAMGDQ